MLVSTSAIGANRFLCTIHVTLVYSMLKLPFFLLLCCHSRNFVIAYMHNICRNVTNIAAHNVSIVDWK